jgi:putative endopeptidase
MKPAPRAVAMALILACVSVSAATAPTRSLLDGMSRSVVPGSDFYAYANGEWLSSTEIPADRASYGPAAQLADVNEQRVADLIRAAAASNPPAGSETRKIADYYTAFLDEATIESRGLGVLKPTMDQITAINNRTSLAHYLGSTLRADVDVLNSTQLHTPNIFGIWVAQDLDNPSRYLPFLLQGGLGMPDRDYYLNESPRMAEDRAHYQTCIATLLKIAGDADAERKAAAILALEHKIAEVHLGRAESEDVKAGDNHWQREQFASRAPGIDWDALFAGADLSQQAEFVVWQPAAITGIAKLVAGEPLQNWKDYLTFHAILGSATTLPKAVDSANFAFYGTALSGTPQQRERWRLAVAATSDGMGEAVGKLYVERYFPPQSKARIEQLVQHLMAAFSIRIDQLTWMAPATKAKAKAKLATLKVSVGYPDHWRDYSGLEVKADDAFGNDRRAQLFEYHRNLAKLGRPVDRSEWAMVPQLVNAVNLPAMNTLNFPAAILQPPYFDPNAPDSFNYGSIGAVIGHEISHSFDDQGALFDASGKLQNWWSDADFAHFRSSADQLVKQFDAYQPFPDLHVNGRQSLSENIADLAGLSASYSAYHLALKGKPAPSIDGLSGDQQFFIAFAQSWRRKTRDAALRQQIVTDGHAPSQYRGVTLRNLDPWYSAFDVKPGQGLYLSPAERVRMW